MTLESRTRSGDIVSKITKREVLDFINFFYIHHDVYPTVDDFVEKMRRPRKVMADFLSRYARFGIVEPFKTQGQKTVYGPGVNWMKVDRLEWVNFFRAGNCPHCGHKGVLGFVGPQYITYRCKWCPRVWKSSREWVGKDVLDEVERQAQKTRKQWVRE